MKASSLVIGAVSLLALSACSRAPSPTRKAATPRSALTASGWRAAPRAAPAHSLPAGPAPAAPPGSGSSAASPALAGAAASASAAPPPVLAAGVSAPAGAASAPAPPAGACPPEMALVEGKTCDQPGFKCLGYLDGQGEGAFLRTHRCREYDPAAAVCKAAPTERRFCIDRDEYVPPGETLPAVNVSWTDAGKLCAAQGKRLCFEREWQFACMGEALQPYPYGWKRDATLCNHDLEDLAQGGKLIDHRVAPAERPGCTSPFGVRNLVGNVDEWTAREGHQPPFRSALRGGWWLAGRNNCLAATTAHDEHYHGAQTGFRCCAEAR